MGKVWTLRVVMILSSYVLARVDAVGGVAFKEPLIPVEPIVGTNLFTGMAYRLHHQYFGQAPIVASKTEFNLQVRGASNRPWEMLPYRIVAERRASQWEKYNNGGEMELNALFMFIRTGISTSFRLINIGAATEYPRSCVCDWTFSHWNTNPTTRYPHSVYCRDEMESGCAYIINAENHAWELEVDGGIYYLKKPGQNLYLGFEKSATVAYMGLFGDRERGRIQVELAGSQLSGTIVQFKILPGTFEKFREVGLIHKHHIINNSSGTLNNTIIVSKSITNFFAFTFSETINEFDSVTVKAKGTFAIFTGGFEMTGALGTKTDQKHEFTTTTEVVFSINQNVTILPFRRVTIDGTIQMTDDVEKKFVAQILGRVTAIRLTSSSRQIVRQGIEHWKLRERLEKTVRGKFIRIVEDGIIYETEGTVRGSYGVSTLLHAKEFPI